MMKHILVTGATGFIASHTIVKLLEKGYSVIGYDNLKNSSPISLERVRKLLSLTASDNRLHFIKGDVRHKKELNSLFSTHPINAVIHFAGLKAVGESVEYPLHYYENNVFGAIQLLKLCQIYQVKHFIFSSSATVYGDPETIPIPETAPLKGTNPYADSKLMVEQILARMVETEPNWSVVNLRYFNPIGAHPTGMIGEDPSGIPNNLIPYIAQTAIGKRPYLNIYGDDYPTPDGTGIRDYIHIMDLAEAHLKALEYSFSEQGNISINIGTGKGYSVLEVLDCFRKISGCEIKSMITQRRAGDIPVCYADVKLAAKILNWQAKYTLKDMIKTSWNWQKQNPEGYQ